MLHAQSGDSTTSKHRSSARDNDWHVTLTIVRSPGTGIQVAKGHVAAFVGFYPTVIERDGKQRKVSFNYTENSALNKIANLFRNLATQENRIFEIEAVRQNDPISTPAQLRYLDNELKSKTIADPERFVTLLQDIKTDESIPLIARNHAERLLKEIKKARPDEILKKRYRITNRKKSVLLLNAYLKNRLNLL